MGKKAVPGSGYGNVFIDSLVWGGTAWDPATPIKVYLGEPSDIITAVEGAGRTNAQGQSDPGFIDADNVESLQGWTNSAEDNAFIYALTLYSSVCGLKFETNTTLLEADIVWWKANLGNGIAGVHETPATQDTGQIWGYFNPYLEASWGNLHFGGDGLNTVIHEIGHGLGLAHPHDGGREPDKAPFPGVQGSTDVGPYGYNQGVYTIMSYNTGLQGAPRDLAYGAQGGLGAFDIATLQALYGTNDTTATGDNVYRLPTLESPEAGYGWSCIWDAGGADTISGETSATSITIDLRPATLVYGDPNAGGFVSQQAGTPGGFTIAKGVVIENASGGRGDDTLIGNAVANELKGNDGSDLLAGLGGVDLLVGGNGDDSLEGGAEADRLDGGAGYDLATYTFADAGVVVNLKDSTQCSGDAKGDIFISIEGVIGSAFNDTITGTDIAELLSGGGGADIMTGGNGDDVYLVDSASDTIVENAAGGYDTIITSQSVSVAQFANCEVLLASSGAETINLSGSENNDKLVGNDGDNVLDGRGGIDDLQGGAGNDSYVLDNAADSVTDTAGIDTAIVSFSYALAAYLENLTGSGANALVLTGNGVGNVMRGGAGADKINGLLGNDALYGGVGRDTFIFNTKVSAANRDKILDFNVKDDTVRLDNAVFKKLGKGSESKPGKLNKKFFAIGQAKDNDDYLIYNKKTGVLSYDADGSGKKFKAVAFLDLANKAKLTIDDFLIV